MPAMMDFRSVPSLTRVTTSDSANTLHWLLMVQGSSP